MRYQRLFRALLLIGAAAFLGCVQAQDMQAEYRLRPGDMIRINVFQNPDLTLETRVTENGNITVPLIGVIRIGGTAIGSVERTIAKALHDGGFVQDPQVTITLQTMRGNVVSVLGQINKPGRIALETVSIRLTEILTMAGGIASTGADSVIVTGVRDGKPFHREVEIAGIFLNKRIQDDLLVADGDVIYVDRAPVFYIYGQINKPGSHRLERGMTVRQALAAAGGPSQRGTERGLGLYRRGVSGTVEKLSDAVQPDDIFYVRESLF
jgi:polysaccharide biosynthesis/export protein